MVKVILLILSVLCMLGVSSAQFTLGAVLHSNPECSGEYLTLATDSYTPHLSSLLFDNRAQSATIIGTWLFYGYDAFNYYEDAGMEYHYDTSNRCVNFGGIAGNVSSVKFAGTSNDYRNETMTLYGKPYFQGTQEFTEIDLSYFYMSISSLIVTGSSAWTIYDRSHYGGNALCVQPEFSPSYEPLFVTDTVLLNPSFPHGSIASVRKGCFADKVGILSNSKYSGTNSNLLK